MAACGVLAMFSAHWGYLSAYALFKPLTMVLALVCVGVVAGRSPLKTSMYLLLAGLALSMVGDVCLLLPQGFIAGLVAFLLAHVCYIALFQRDAPWLASRLSLAACIAVGTMIYAYLWTHGLPTAMRIPVAVYVLVIGLMAAQALGRRRAAYRSGPYGGVGRSQFHGQRHRFGFRQICAAHCGRLPLGAGHVLPGAMPDFAWHAAKPARNFTQAMSCQRFTDPR